MRRSQASGQTSLQTQLSRAVLAVAVAAAPSCTIWVNGELGKIAVPEGEGEGEGNEGEGEGEASEGEGEGEGEGDNDNDPACELDERLVVARDAEDRTDVLQVFALEPGRFVRVRPDGQPGNVNLENEEAGADTQSAISAFALGTNGRMYVGGDNFIYQIDQPSLTQESITGRTALRIGTSVHAMEVIGGQVWAIGDSVFQVAEGAGVGVPAAEVATTDDYHRSTHFSIRNSQGQIEDFVAMNGRFGYAIYSSIEGSAPSVTVSYDEDFTEKRFHDFVGGTFQPRGIAFDATTKKLLLGDINRMIVLEASNGFAINPNDDSTDFVVPGVTDFDEFRVVAIAARGGFAWVLLDRSIDNLFRVDLSTVPPTATQIGTVGTSSFGRSLAVGCKRLIISDFQTVFAVERDTLDPITQFNVPDVEQISLVKRTALGLTGDE